MNNQELTYWVTLAFIPKIWTKRKNEIYVRCYTHQPRLSVIQLFEEEHLWDEIGLNSNEKIVFKEAKQQLANNAFLVEELLKQGFHIIPVDSTDYPKTLKNNLKHNSPTILFAKGNLQLLKKNSVAVVGSRNASSASILFTSNVTQQKVSEGNVIVSGFAKGVDQQALNAAVDSKGESIIVLPQGITTFSSGFKKYYKYIMTGKVLVISSFYPKAPWSVELAMARNAIIYGMANSIYVAQSDEKGGTWAGVIEGLRKAREIFVRYPETDEKNANKLLIQRGCKPVDMMGMPLQISQYEMMTPEEREQKETEEKIMLLLRNGQFTSQELKRRLQLDWTDAKIKILLRKMLGVTETKIKNKVYFSVPDLSQSTLFASED